MVTGLDKTLALLDSWQDLEVVVPVLGSALTESSVASQALERLRSCRLNRAPREILRHYEYLSPEQQQCTLGEDADRMLAQASLLLRSPHGQTRLNIARYGSDLLARAPENFERVLPALLVLVDDPQIAVRDLARGSFLAALDPRIPRDDLRWTPRHPVVAGLTILLRRYEQHGDTQVISALIQLGEVGHQILATAIGESWQTESRIEAHAFAEDTPRRLPQLVAALFRWLRSPFSGTREAARRIIRERTDTPFLAEVAKRLDSSDPRIRADDPPVYRHIHWHALPADVLAQLPRATVIRLARYVHSSSEEPETKAERLGGFLEVPDDDVRREVLTLLRDLPTSGLVGPIDSAFDSEDSGVQLLATELMEPDGSRRSFEALVRQLSSPHEEVRAATHRKLAGHSLSILFGSFSSLTREERQRIIPVLEKVDLHFMGQLRRALRSSRETDAVLALRTVLDGNKVAEFEEELYDLTVSPSARVRATLTRAFAQIDTEATTHYLRLFLEDSDLRVVANTIETIAAGGDPQAIPWLLPYRDHGDCRVRVNALVGLAQLGDAQSQATLNKLSEGSPVSPLTRSARWGRQKLSDAMERSRHALAGK